MTKEKAQARREHLARMRAEQKRKERRAALLMWGIGGLVIVVLIALVTVYVVKDRSARSLSAVKTFNYKGSDHSWQKVAYKETPPVGGQHNFYWQNCGIYDKPIHNEHAVHSLEHGAVWITYRPELPKAEVDKLKTLASADYMLLSPFPNLPYKIVVSSWNRQLALDSADDPRLPEFIKKYKQNPTTTPEYGASCSGGIGTTDEQPLPPEPSASADPMATATPSS
ncbi:hypothetical protein GCM10010116_19710 [Microbispora rosea subsp. aerata]|nr:DUF3105 domain-containing protein [Microbispora rosea]GGO09818.1 hypothetical protein GCM10010116_19710 [Microbispora rosea subsp. aerata]GIH53414.1 hypothetical protein Mro02_03280 [Microbispora rosea subsp. aerata]GLJ83095.1 hypothetical protein GCM10017588_18210 [Microbispora rosea subsp. aerata]